MYFEGNSIQIWFTELVDAATEHSGARDFLETEGLVMKHCLKPRHTDFSLVEFVIGPSGQALITQAQLLGALERSLNVRHL